MLGTFNTLVKGNKGNLFGGVSDKQRGFNEVRRYNNDLMAINVVIVSVDGSSSFPIKVSL